MTTLLCSEHGIFVGETTGSKPLASVPCSVACTWERIQRQAEEEHTECGPELVTFRPEIERVRELWGNAHAMEFALFHFEITPLAFLREFGLMSEGEKLGVFAL